jgi:hypothetical protein
MADNEPTYVADVLLLCSRCREPIKATITTAQWIKVQWIGPEGECQRCWSEAREVKK